MFFLWSKLGEMRKDKSPTFRELGGPLGDEPLMQITAVSKCWLADRKAVRLSAALGTERGGRWVGRTGFISTSWYLI